MVALTEKQKYIASNSFASHCVYVSLVEKMSFRIKQIGLALCLMMSLLIGHASACACSHHVEKKAVESSDCHSHNKTAEAQTVEAVNDSNACDTDCVCLTEQPSPYIAENSISKNFNATDAAANAEQVVSDIEFRPSTAYAESSSEFVNDLSYSTTLKSLLPARAPPRL